MKVVAAVVGAALLLGMGFATSRLVQEQAADETFRFDNPDPAFAPEGGPLVCVDAAHHNYHTADDRYRPFAELLRADGYRVESFESTFSPEALERCDLLVIANPRADANAGADWSFPHPSAFTRDELEATYSFVQSGGALLLISDHAPFAGATQDLAMMLGIGALDGYAYHPTQEPDIFRSEMGTLADHAITRGRSQGERVDHVVTWTGQAFVAAEGIDPLIIWGPGAVTAVGIGRNFPDIPRDEWPLIQIEGWLHAAAAELEAGRFVVLGEAAMCTAQSEEDLDFGISAPEADQNAQFCLNVVRWLTGVL
jgi:hypothetical protein